MREENSTSSFYSDASAATFTFFDIMVQKSDVLVAVLPRVLVMEAEGVQNLVDDAAHAAVGAQEQRLLPADASQERRAPARDECSGRREEEPSPPLRLLKYLLHTGP